MTKGIVTLIALLVLTGCGSASAQTVHPHLVAVAVSDGNGNSTECADHSTVKQLPSGVLYCGPDIPADPGAGSPLVINLPTPPADKP